MKWLVLLWPIAIPAQDSDRWRSTLAVEVGSSAIDSGLTEIGSLAVHSATQTIFVSQPPDSRVLMFGFDGKLRGRIGRAGDGPGEFRRLARLAWIADTLVVQDGTRRAHYFKRDGTLLRSTMLPAFRVPAGETSVATTAILAQGVLLGASSMGAREIAANLRTYHLGDAEGVISRTIVRTGVPAGIMHVRGTLMFNERLEGLFGNAALVVTAPDGRSLTIVERDAVADRGGTSPVRVTRMTATGDTLWSTVHGFPTTSVPRRLSDSAITSIADGWSKSGLANGAESERVAREHVRLPASLPPVTAALHGEDNSVWLRSRTERGDSVDWRVLDESGKLRGTIAMPRRATLLHATRASYWMVVPDDDDLPAIRRYVLSR